MKKFLIYYLFLFLFSSFCFASQIDVKNDDISIRMTGCPNGCGRSYVSEIGFVGTSAGHYNLMLGGDRYGVRLNKIYKEKVNETEILNELDQVFESYTKEKIDNETFGDFTYRKYFSVN